MKAAPIIAIALAASGFSAGAALAQEPIKIGVSVGLTGYAAAVDRAWRDGLEVAADYVNSRGGVLGRKVQLVVEDNKSEPQEAVTVYRKMISSDKVNLFISGCVSAGTFAAAPFVVRAQIPMFLCSILPPQPDQVTWAYSFLAPPRFEVEICRRATAKSSPCAPLTSTLGRASWWRCLAPTGRANPRCCAPSRAWAAPRAASNSVARPCPGRPLRSLRLGLRWCPKGAACSAP